MKMLTLKLVTTGAQGTFGVLLDNDEPFCLTLEDPWKNNEPNVSCIPDGMYNCERAKSPKFGDTFEVTRVTGRTHILFHRGNTQDDTHGCILVGEQYSRLNDKWAIVVSGDAFNEFMRRMGGEKVFQLLVKFV